MRERSTRKNLHMPCIYSIAKQTANSAYKAFHSFEISDKSRAVFAYVSLHM